MKTGPTCPGTMGPCPGVCPVRCGTVPEGSRDAPCAGLAPPGSVLPARIPLENCSRVGAGRFGGRWGRRGGRRAKAAPALEAPDYRRTKASTLPQVGCLYPGERLRAAQCLWAAGGQVAASSVGGVAPDLLGRGGDEGCCAAARRRPPIPAIGSGSMCLAAGSAHPRPGVWLALPRRLCGYAV